MQTYNEFIITVPGCNSRTQYVTLNRNTMQTAVISHKASKKILYDIGSSHHDDANTNAS